MGGMLKNKIQCLIQSAELNLIVVGKDFMQQQVHGTRELRPSHPHKIANVVSLGECGRPALTNHQTTEDRWADLEWTRVYKMDAATKNMALNKCMWWQVRLQWQNRCMVLFKFVLTKNLKNKKLKIKNENGCNPDPDAAHWEEHFNTLFGGHQTDGSADATFCLFWRTLTLQLAFINRAKEVPQVLAALLGTPLH